MSQHAGLTLERWMSFGLDRQILMIANEMNRGSSLLGPDVAQRLRNTYERVLALVDLTVRANDSRALRRELLRWRGLVGELYVAPAGNASAHTAALRAVLQFTPVASAQIPHLVAPGTG